MGYPSTGLDGGTYPVRTGWGYPCRDWMVVPPPHQDWVGYPPSGLDGEPPHPIRTGWEYPPVGTWWGYLQLPNHPLNPLTPPPSQETDQQGEEHLLCSRQYASCLHAGGLSCLTFICLKIKYLKYTANPIFRIEMGNGGIFSVDVVKIELGGMELAYILYTTLFVNVV